MANVEHWYNLPFEHSEADMDYLVNNILTLVAAHILLITAVLMNAINAKQPAKLEDLYDMQLVVICRFIGSIVLQMAVLPKLSQGMQTMKYALNHPWHFKTLWLTTSISGLQILVVIYFEIVKMYVFYRSADLWDLLINFSIMAVISNIDDFLYKTILEESPKNFIKSGSNWNLACEDAATNSEIQDE